MLARVLLHVPTRVFLHVLPREEHMCYIAKSNMCSMLALGMAMWLGWGNIFHIDRGSIQNKAIKDGGSTAGLPPNNKQKDHQSN